MCVILMLIFSWGVNATFPTIPNQLLSIDNSPLHITIGDLNDDGLGDIAITDSGTNKLKIYLQKKPLRCLHPFLWEYLSGHGCSDG